MFTPLKISIQEDGDSQAQMLTDQYYRVLKKTT